MRASLRLAIPLVVLVSVLGGCGSSPSTQGGATTDGWTRIDPATLQERLKDPATILVNVHVPYEGEIPGTDAFIPYDRISEQTSDLPTDPADLVIYCRSGNMSAVAAQALVAAGYRGFSELSGGYDAWQAAGLPFTTPTPTA